jgi:hypothetical protein
MMQPTFGMRLLQRLSRLIGWCFGMFWALLGASALPHPYDRAGRVVAVVVALVFLVRLWRSEPSAGDGRPRFRMSVYLMAVAAELLGMYVAALWLTRLGAQQQVYSAIGCIVGLHFIGLWLATRSSRFLHITAGMCVVSVVSMIVPYTWHAVGLRYVLLGLGNAAVLWIAASGKN